MLSNLNNTLYNLPLCIFTAQIEKNNTHHDNICTCNTHEHLQWWVI